MKLTKAVIIATFLYLVSNIVYSVEINSFSIENLDINYVQDSGNIYADKIIVENNSVKTEINNYQLSILKDQTSMSFKNDKVLFTLKNINESILKNIELLEIAGANINIHKGKKFYLAFNQAEFQLGRGIQSINKVNLECKSLQSRNGDLLSFLLPCLKLGRLSIPILKIDELSRSTFSTAVKGHEFISANGQELSDKKAFEELKDIQISIINNQYQLKLKTKFLFNFKLRARGKINYDEQSSRVIISLDWAKVGIFSVRKRILKIIKKAKFSNVIVDDRNIIIDL